MTIYLNGDEVMTKSGKKAIILDSWGVAREWYKLRADDGEILFVMSAQIDRLIKRHSKKGRKWK